MKLNITAAAVIAPMQLFTKTGQKNLMNKKASGLTPTGLFSFN
jgi:hypothetical protein